MVVLSYSLFQLSLAAQQTLPRLKTLTHHFILLKILWIWSSTRAHLGSVFLWSAWYWLGKLGWRIHFQDDFFTHMAGASMLLGLSITPDSISSPQHSLRVHSFATEWMAFQRVSFPRDSGWNYKVFMVQPTMSLKPYSFWPNKSLKPAHIQEKGSYFSLLMGEVTKKFWLSIIYHVSFILEMRDFLTSN